MRKTVNLNKTAGTYASEITSNWAALCEQYEATTISTEEFKNFAKTVVEPAKETNAKLNFLINLNRQKTKDGILMLLNNVMLRAEHLGANINDRWSNEL